MSLYIEGNMILPDVEQDAQLLVSVALTAEGPTGSPTVRNLDVSALGTWKKVRVIIVSSVGVAMMNDVFCRNTSFPEGTTPYYNASECHAPNPADAFASVGLKVTVTSTWQYSCMVNGNRTGATIYIYKLA